MEQYGTGAIMQNFLKWTRIVEDSNFQIPNHRTSMGAWKCKLCIQCKGNPATFKSLRAKFTPLNENLAYNNWNRADFIRLCILESNIQSLKLRGRIGAGEILLVVLLELLKWDRFECAQFGICKILIIKDHLRSFRAPFGIITNSGNWKGECATLAMFIGQ